MKWLHGCTDPPPQRQRAALFPGHPKIVDGGRWQVYDKGIRGKWRGDLRREEMEGAKMGAEGEPPGTALLEYCRTRLQSGVSRVAKEKYRSFEEYLGQRQQAQDLVVLEQHVAHLDAEQGAPAPPHGPLPPLKRELQPDDVSASPPRAQLEASPTQPAPLPAPLPPIKAAPAQAPVPPSLPVPKAPCTYVFNLPNTAKKGFVEPRPGGGEKEGNAWAVAPQDPAAASLFTADTPGAFVDAGDLTFTQTTPEGVDRVGSLRFCPKVTVGDLRKDMVRMESLVLSSVKSRPKKVSIPDSILGPMVQSPSYVARRYEEIDFESASPARVLPSPTPAVIGSPRAPVPELDDPPMKTAPAEDDEEGVAREESLFAAARTAMGEHAASTPTIKRKRASRASTQKRHSYPERLDHEERTLGTGTPVFEVPVAYDAPAPVQKRPKDKAARKKSEPSLGVGPWDADGGSPRSDSPLGSVAASVQLEAHPPTAIAAALGASLKEVESGPRPDSPLTVCRKTLDEFQQSPCTEPAQAPVLDEGDAVEALGPAEGETGTDAEAEKEPEPEPHAQEASEVRVVEDPATSEEASPPSAPHASVPEGLSGAEVFLLDGHTPSLMTFPSADGDDSLPTAYSPSPASPGMGETTGTLDTAEQPVPCLETEEATPQPPVNIGPIVGNVEIHATETEGATTDAAASPRTDAEGEGVGATPLTDVLAPSSPEDQLSLSVSVPSGIRMRGVRGAAPRMAQRRGSRTTYESDDDPESAPQRRGSRSGRRPSIAAVAAVDRVSRRSSRSDSRSNHSVSPTPAIGRLRSPADGVLDVIEARFRHVASTTASPSLTLEEVGQLGAAQRWKCLERAGQALCGEHLAAYRRYHREVREVGDNPPSEVYSHEHARSSLIESSLSLLPTLKGGRSRSPSIADLDVQSNATSTARRSSRALDPESDRATSRGAHTPRSPRRASLAEAKGATPGTSSLRRQSMAFDPNTATFHALIVAVAKYGDARLPDAPRVGSDAFALRATLERVGYSVVMLYSNAEDPALRPTKANIEREAQAFMDRAAPQCYRMLVYLGTAAVECDNILGGVDGMRTHILPEDYALPLSPLFSSAEGNSLPLDDTFGLKPVAPTNSSMYKLFYPGQAPTPLSRPASFRKTEEGAPEPVVIVDATTFTGVKGLAARPSHGFGYFASAGSMACDFCCEYAPQQRNVMTYYVLKGLSGGASRDSKVTSSVLMQYMKKKFGGLGFKDSVTMRTTSEPFYSGAVMAVGDGVVTSRQYILNKTERSMYPARFVAEGWLAVSEDIQNAPPVILRQKVVKTLAKGGLFGAPASPAKAPPKRRASMAASVVATPPHEAAVKTFHERFGVMQWQLVSLMQTHALRVEVEPGAAGASAAAASAWEEDIVAWSGGAPGVRYVYVATAHELLITVRAGPKEQTVAAMVERHLRGDVTHLAGRKITGLQRGCQVSFSGTCMNYLKADKAARLGSAYWTPQFRINEVYPWVGGWRYHSASVILQRRWRGVVGRKVYSVLNSVTAQVVRAFDELEAEWLEGLVEFHWAKLREQQEEWVMSKEVERREDLELWECEDREDMSDATQRSVDKLETLARRGVTRAFAGSLMLMKAEERIGECAAQHACLLTLVEKLTKKYEKCTARTIMLHEEEAKKRSDINYEFGLGACKSPSASPMKC
eukprot:TRINITY_DN24999_c0_g1_i1.p1 TRINITY_DN24999_c0_g1~~TRINITY_DN24999_c0_g1_i1.p1  ORF type:complete len:1674 (+),score=483.05 TRINITY_DN24999_c0_g1_i1:163-5184(+)